MSWLYSILITGLLISSNAEVPTTSPEQAAPRERAIFQQDVTEKFDQTYPLSPNGRVSVSNVNGPVVVESWDRNEVRIEATKIADSAETLAEVEIDVDASGDRVSVRADHKGSRFNAQMPRDRNRRVEVHFKLSVPRGARLDEIATVNGVVTVSDFENAVKVSAVNGDINATNLKGSVKLSTVNGRVRAEITETSAENELNLSTVNGSIALVLPSDINATIKADSLNGNISNDFGLPVKKGEYVGRNLYGRIGSGEVQVKLDSVNGPLTITRRDDGRPTNPAINLLQGSTGRDPGRAPVIDRSVARSMKEAEKEAAKALEAARIQMEAIQPELARVRVDMDPEKMKELIQAGLAREKAALAVLANVNWGASVPMLKKQEKSFPVDSDVRVNITAEDCDVSVRTWDRQEVRYVLTERTGRLSEGEAKVTEKVSKDSIELTVNGEEALPFAGAAGSRIEVYVPRGARVTVKANSRIRVSGTSGETEVFGEDAPIDIRDVSGRLRINAADARVRVIGMKGSVESVAENGSVYLEGEFERLTSRSDSADVTLTLDPAADVRITANTAIETEGIRGNAGGAREITLGGGKNHLEFEVNGGRILVRDLATLGSK